MVLTCLWDSEIFSFVIQKKNVGRALKNADYCQFKAYGLKIKIIIFVSTIWDSS